MHNFVGNGVVTNDVDSNDGVVDGGEVVGVGVDVIRRRHVRGSDAFVVAVKSVVVFPPWTSVSYDDNNDDGGGDDDIGLLAPDPP